MAREPTPPAPPRMRMDLPAEKPARSRPSWAVSTASGSPAACAKSRFLGFIASSFSSTAVYSASDPDCLGPSNAFSLMLPYTSSPSLSPFTWLPAFTTTPATSYPGTAAAVAGSAARARSHRRANHRNPPPVPRAAGMWTEPLPGSLSVAGSVACAPPLSYPSPPLRAANRDREKERGRPDLEAERRRRIRLSPPSPLPNVVAAAARSRRRWGGRRRCRIRLSPPSPSPNGVATAGEEPSRRHPIVAGEEGGRSGRRWVERRR
uniref:Uncharacterized protein n=1 Tax=Oryza punctata TaxID=4537 RepID=A0A0E0LUG9_ORYPU